MARASARLSSRQDANPINNNIRNYHISLHILYLYFIYFQLLFIVAPCGYAGVLYSCTSVRVRIPCSSVSLYCVVSSPPLFDVGPSPKETPPNDGCASVIAIVAKSTSGGRMVRMVNGTVRQSCVFHSIYPLHISHPCFPSYSPLIAISDICGCRLCGSNHCCYAVVLLVFAHSAP